MSENLLSLSSPSVWGILLRFSVNMVFIFILIRIIYFRYSKKENFLFTFFLIGIIVFFICSMLREVDIAIGMGLGLFAIFTILRFRTRNFSVKDMAYIFTTIGVSVINTFDMLMFPFIGVFIINVIILGAVFILEEFLRKNSFNKHSIIYDDLDLLKPGNKSKLLKDISSKLGQEVLRIKVRRVDFKRETAEVDVFFRD
ncbi:MAG TPA: DUF4956 domain-containing protein [Bacteroidales bacterium]|nr:DUF4956 domain-containing protein [Bacteroidales bacterium]